MLPDCGATVTFTGTARDHAEGRPGVHRLEYEAYEEPALARLRAIAAEVRRRWPVVGRVALLHRTGVVELGDAAVVVAVSAPHRGEAFEAARFAIDELKRTVPDLEARVLGRRRELGPRGAAPHRGGTDLMQAVLFLAIVVVVCAVGGARALRAAPAAEHARVGHGRLPAGDGRAGAAARRAGSPKLRMAKRPTPRSQRPPSGRSAVAAMARDLAIDLGTANTLVYERGRGIVLNEPTVIALNERTQEVLAMGHEAWQMIGRTPGYIVAVRPLRQGAITDFEITQRMIRLLLHRVGVNRFNRPAGRDLRAVGHHRGRAAGRHRGRPPGRGRRRAAHRAADGGGHRRRAPDPRAGGQHGRRRRRRHVRDRPHLPRRGGGPQGGAGRQLRHRRRHHRVHPPRVRHRGGRAHRRGDQDGDRLGRRRCATRSRPRCGAAT